MNFLSRLFHRTKPEPVVEVPSTIPVKATIPEPFLDASEVVKTQEQKKSAVLGCILGQAIGDALGHPYEFNKSGVQSADIYPGATFTDDTQMMDAIARALLAVPPHEHGMDAFMDKLVEEFVSWQRAPLGGSHRSPGGACSSSCSRLRQGIHWMQSGGLSSKGNGTAMRSSVVGAFYHRDLRMAWEVGCMTAIPTHNNLEAILMAGTVSLLCACGINGMPFAEAMTLVFRNIAHFNETVPQFPKNVSLGEGYNDQNPWYAASHLAQAYAGARSVTVTDARFHQLNGDDFATVPATAAAVFFNTRYSNFRDIVRKCVANTSDCDTTGAIAGAIAGSRFTAQFIPLEWRQNVELSDYFHVLATKVWAASQTVNADTRETADRTR